MALPLPLPHTAQGMSHAWGTSPGSLPGLCPGALRGAVPGCGCVLTPLSVRALVGAGLSDLTVESAGLVPISQMTQLWLGRGTWASWGRLWGGAALQALGWGTAELAGSFLQPSTGHSHLPPQAFPPPLGPSPGPAGRLPPVPRVKAAVLPAPVAPRFPALIPPCALCSGVPRVPVGRP